MDAISKSIPGATNLTLCDPPPLPQQTDKISCGIFVILYIIYHGFIDAPKTKDEPLPRCEFGGSLDDLFSYRLFLLAWIFHSQVSLFVKTTPTLLSFLGDDIKRRQLIRAEGITEAAGSQQKRPSRDARRKLFMSIIDDVAKDRIGVMDTCMKLLNLHSDGKIIFLSTAWYREVKAGRNQKAMNQLQEEATGHALQEVIGFCAPLLVGGEWNLAVVNSYPSCGAIHLHGRKEIIAKTFAAVSENIVTFFRANGIDETFEQTIHALDGLTEAQVSLAMIIMCMEVCRQGNVEKQPTPPAYSDATLGQESYWADKVGLMRWLLWHDERI